MAFGIFGTIGGAIYLGICQARRPRKKPHRPEENGGSTCAAG